MRMREDKGRKDEDVHDIITRMIRAKSRRKVNDKGQITTKSECTEGVWLEKLGTGKRIGYVGMNYGFCVALATEYLE